jgi:hypothetical protein
MNAAALHADEGPFEMDPKDLCAGFVRLVLLSDVNCNSFDGAKSLVGAGGHCGGY